MEHTEQSTIMKKILTLFIALCAVLALPLSAATYTFNAASTTPSPFGGLRHNWADPANWTPLGFPFGGPPLNVDLAVLPPGAVTSGGATVVYAFPGPVLNDLTFSVSHNYVVSVTNCVSCEIAGTLSQNGAGDALIEGGAGRVHLLGPTLAGTGAGKLTVVNPASVTGPITVNAGHHEW